MPPLAIEDMLRRQRLLDTMIKRVVRFIRRGDWHGTCLTSGDVLSVAYGVPPRTTNGYLQPNPCLAVMLYAWMDRYYPRVRTPTQSHASRWRGSYGSRNNGIVWRVR